MWCLPTVQHDREGESATSAAHNTMNHEKTLSKTGKCASCVIPPPPSLDPSSYPCGARDHHGGDTGAHRNWGGAQGGHAGWVLAPGVCLLHENLVSGLCQSHILSHKHYASVKSFLKGKCVRREKQSITGGPVLPCGLVGAMSIHPSFLPFFFLKIRCIEN